MRSRKDLLGQDKPARPDSAESVPYEFDKRNKIGGNKNVVTNR